MARLAVGAFAPDGESLNAVISLGEDAVAVSDCSKAIDSSAGSATGIFATNPETAIAYSFDGRTGRTRRAVRSRHDLRRRAAGDGQQGGGRGRPDADFARDFRDRGVAE